MLEVCVDSFESVEAAVKGGAGRIELCSALSEGGLTPSVGLLKAVKSHFADVKVFAMLRTHGRVSYQHTNIDMEIIKEDMFALIVGGVDGFVFGALTADREIDVDKCQQVIDIARVHKLPVTFHRAFDMTIPDSIHRNIDKIAACGFARILSSGLAETAELGIKTLIDIQKYISQKNYQLILLPGCGVTVQNAETILQSIGCKEIHASAKVRLHESIPSNRSDTKAIENEIARNAYSITNGAIVEQIVNIGKLYLKQ